MHEQKRGIMVLLAFLMAALVVISGGISCGCSAPSQVIEDITPEEAYALLQDNKDNPDFVILDVQSSGEYAEKHLENAIHIPFYSSYFNSEVKKLDRNKTYLVYGRIGACGQSASRQMKKLGFREVYSLSQGGLFQWEKKGFPVVVE